MFSDIQNHWARECILQLQGRGLINGYPDRSFRPNAPVTRAEFAAIIAKAFSNLPLIRSGKTFRDVPVSFWANTPIQTAYRMGFISGYPDQTFKPSQQITRVQVFVALVSGLKYPATISSGEIIRRYFDDGKEIPSYAVNAIASATQQRIIVNHPNIKRLNPNQNATRGEVAAIICRVLNLPGTPIQFIPGLENFVIPPQFDEADAFVNGVARVKLGNKWGYIDKSGKQVISPQFDEATSFSLTPQLALVRNQNLTLPRNDGVTQTRGIWLTTTDSTVFNSRENITAAVEFLAQTGFNVIFPVVWNNAYTMYPSRVMRDTFGREIDPRFAGRDPLAELITAAKRVGIAVIPWFEYGFASSFNLNGGFILSSKPQWSGRDINGNLLKKNGFEWMNALDEEVQNFLMSLVLEVVKNYDIAGIQGDDRMPALPAEGGYDTKTVARYQQQFNQPPPTNHRDSNWLQWRADILSDFLTRLYREVIKINPNLIISMAPNAFPWGLQEYLQDAQAWVDWGLVDLIHPQLYRRDLESYQQFIDRLVNQQLLRSQLPFVAPGIMIKFGLYRITPEMLLQKIQYNRQRGINGEVLFFYEGLREDNEALAKALRFGPYATPAPFNISQVKAQGFTNSRIGGSYSYIDISGKSLIQPQFDEVDAYINGFARVRMGYKWSYIDSIGKLITRLQFDEAQPFILNGNAALALVKIRNKYGFIDTTGKFVIPLRFDNATSFQAGFAAVQINGKYGYIDANGKVVIPPQFDEAETFSEGLAKVKLTGKYGYIDITGKVVISPQFDNVKSFANGLAPVLINGRWGYINNLGQIVIPAQFLEAESFSANLAVVKINNKFAYIDKVGKIVISPDFDEAKPYQEGLAMVKFAGKWGYIKQ